MAKQNILLTEDSISYSQSFDDIIIESKINAMGLSYSAARHLVMKTIRNCGNNVFAITNIFEILGGIFPHQIIVSTVGEFVKGGYLREIPNVTGLKLYSRAIYKF